MLKMVSLTTFFALWVTGICQADDLRTWNSLDGSATIDATFVGYDAKKKTVELLTSDDRTLTIDLARLSKPDQRYVKLVARKNRQTRKSHQRSKEIDEKSKPTNRNTRSRSPKNSRELFGIHWTQDIGKALDVAKGTASPSDDRPVMWLRVLGDLNGFM